MRTDFHGQKGAAAVEAILIIPFLLLMIILTVSSLRVSLLKLHNVVDARSAAWQASMFETPCRRTREESFGGFDLGENCVDDTGLGNAYLTSLGRGSTPYRIQFVGIIRREGVPATTTGTGESEFHPFRDVSGFRVPLSDSHSVDARQMWNLEGLPSGYQEILARLWNQ